MTCFETSLSDWMIGSCVFLWADATSEGMFRVPMSVLRKPAICAMAIYMYLHYSKFMGLREEKHCCEYGHAGSLMYVIEGDC